MSLLFSIVILTTLAQTAFPSHAQFDCPPRDEAARDTEFVAFRAKLRAAVARRDLAAVLSVTDPDIQTSFGIDDGLEFFKRDLANKAGEKWKELETVLALGGVFETPTQFVAPYTWACGEPGEVVVVASNVRVRSRPSSAAPVLAVMSFAVLKGSEAYERNGWATVSLPDGRRGFMAGRFVRSAIGMRAYFLKSNGSWRLVAFIGGD